MTTAQHTPGPWTDDGDFYVWADGEIIASIGVLGIPETQSLANARLIAAAPETAAERDRLLVEKEELLKAMPTDAFFDLMRAALRPDAGVAFHQIEKMAAACRAAITKAEGRS